jgi:hypothetical protein
MQKYKFPLLIATLLALPLSYLSFAAMYMPEPISTLGKLVLAPLLLLDLIGSKDPINQPSEIHLWVQFSVCQLLWFWFLGVIVTICTTWLRGKKSVT